MYYLACYFEGIYQSWGNGKREYKTTSTFPTKSAFVGAAVSATGLYRNQDLIRWLYDLEMSSLILSSRENILRDFQINGSDKKNPLIRSDGTICNHSQRFNKFYLVNTKTAVILIGRDEDKQLLDKLNYCLKYPKNSIWLGRKSNIPTAPIHFSEELFRNYDDCICALLNKAKPRKDEKYFKIIEEARGVKYDYILYDVIYDFTLRKITGRAVIERTEEVEKYLQC